MQLRNYYAVVATENHVSDFKALFDDEGDAELHRQRICGDECDYAVVQIMLDVNTVVARL